MSVKLPNETVIPCAIRAERGSASEMLLAADIPATTDVAVIDVSQIPASLPTEGTVIIDNEVFNYTGVAGSSFTGVTRGVNMTGKLAHFTGAVVAQAPWFIRINGSWQLMGYVQPASSIPYPEVAITNPAPADTFDTGISINYIAEAFTPGMYDDAFTYDWAFDDSTTDSGASVTKSWAVAGAHTATVTATDTVTGLTATTSITNTINLVIPTWHTLPYGNFGMPIAADATLDHVYVVHPYTGAVYRTDHTMASQYWVGSCDLQSNGIWCNSDGTTVVVTADTISSGTYGFSTTTTNNASSWTNWNSIFYHQYTGGYTSIYSTKRVIPYGPPSRNCQYMYYMAYDAGDVFSQILETTNAGLVGYGAVSSMYQPPSYAADMGVGQTFSAADGILTMYGAVFSDDFTKMFGIGHGGYIKFSELPNPTIDAFGGVVRLFTMATTVDAPVNVNATVKICATGTIEHIGMFCTTDTNSAWTLYISNDYGASWTMPTLTPTLVSTDMTSPTDIYCSFNGQYWIACFGGTYGTMFRSDDYGATWTQIVDVGLTDFNQAVISDDGTRAVAINNGVYAYAYY